MTEIQQIPLALLVVLTGALSYLAGCFCTGYYFVRFKTGKDLRTIGSGTVGARNAGRELGKTGFAVTFLGDLFKGVLAVSATRMLVSLPLMTALSLVAVVLGHVFPAQLHFRGGKGYATLTGGVLALSPKLVLILFLCVVLCGVVTRLYKPCGLMALALLPFASIPVIRELECLVGISIAVVIVLAAHRKNIAAGLNLLFCRRVEKDISLKR
ncbi:MAG: glycerol-3-phosphate acyltransferase [Kiritimatiellae bacterium]|nr:glycerol-3-phosphate acyltransferase [Kiritimatiellia bacterium]MDD5522307.1 glycerol-3-phosphate acyltransferase [Kiritimatiellia bacterium]